MGNLIWFSHWRDENNKPFGFRGIKSLERVTGHDDGDSAQITY